MFFNHSSRVKKEMLLDQKISQIMMIWWYHILGYIIRACLRNQKLVSCYYTKRPLLPFFFWYVNLKTAKMGDVSVKGIDSHFLTALRRWCFWLAIVFSNPFFPVCRWCFHLSLGLAFARPSRRGSLQETWSKPGVFQMQDCLVNFIW